MNKPHKYFRKQKYKQKLENMVGKSDRVYFLTKEPDFQQEKENQHKKWYKGPQKVKARNYYLYWNRPEVDYATIEYTSPRRSKMNKYYKKRSNRKLRQDIETYNHGLYKKKFDIKWSLD